MIFSVSMSWFSSAKVYSPCPTQYNNDIQLRKRRKHNFLELGFLRFLADRLGQQFHPKQEAHQVEAPHSELVQAHDRNKRDGKDDQILQQVGDRPLHHEVAQGYDHSLVQDVEWKRRFVGVVQERIGEVEVRHADRENRQQPTPHHEAVQHFSQRIRHWEQGRKNRLKFHEQVDGGEDQSHRS